MGKKVVIVDVELNTRKANRQAAQLTAEITKLRTERSALNKELKELQKNEAENAEEIRRVSRAIVDKNVQLKENQRALNLVQRSIQANGNSLDEMRAKLSRAQRAVGQFRVGVDGTQDELDQLTKSTKTLSDAVKEQEEEMGDARRSVGDYGKALREAFSGDFSGIFELRENINGLSSALLTPQGLVAGLALGVGTATVAFAKWSQQLEADRAQVEQLTGATGDLSNQLAGASRALEQTFENADAEASLRAINTLTQELGGNLADNFDALNVVAARTGPNFDEVLDIIREYPAQFRDSETSAKEFLAIATQAVTEGFFSDKGIDAIKEGQIRLREMTPAAREAIDAIGLSADEIQSRLEAGTTTLLEETQMIAQQLTTLEADSPAYAQAVADIFGGAGEDAGSRFFEFLANVNTEFDDLEENLTDAQRRQLELAEANRTIETTWNQLFASSGAFFDQAEVGFKQLVAEGLTSAVNGIQSFVNWWIDLYNESVAFRAIFQQVFANVETAFDFVVAVGSQVVNVISTIADGLKAVFTLDFDAFTEALSGGFERSVDIALDFGKDVAENYIEATENTFRAKKIEPVNLLGGGTTEAEEAGKAAGEGYVKGFNQSLDGMKIAEERAKAEEEANKKAIDERLRAQTALIEIELQGLEEGSAARLQKQIELLKAEKEQKLNNERLIAEERLLIEAQTLQEINKLTEKFITDEQAKADEALKAQRERRKAEADAIIKIEEERAARLAELAEEEAEREERARELREEGIEGIRSGAEEIGNLLVSNAEAKAEERIAAIEADETISDSAKEAAIAVVESEKEKSAAYQAGKAIQKAAAIAEVGINLGKQLGQISATAAAISGAFPPVSVALGVAYQAIQSALAVAGAAQRVSQIRALEEGGDGTGGSMTTITVGNGGIKHNGQPVAIDAGAAQRGGFIDRPTISLMSDGQPAIMGEGYKTEYVVPSRMLKIPEIAAAVSGIERRRIRGFEFGGFSNFSLPAYVDGGFSQLGGAAGIGSEALETAFARALNNQPAPIVRVLDIKDGLEARTGVEETGNI